ncbi:recombination protein RecR [Candidatus Microgenomates bacterium]|nr:recombination protein RecR [Candidatus Microgenomates bacterium]
MIIPRAIQNLIEAFQRLPGIGPKTAQRLTFYLLHVPQRELDRFAEALSGLKRNTKTCSICKNVDEIDPCSLCQDQNRDHSKICVVEDVLDVLAIEKSGKHRGVYHVLHGRIDPLNNIGPDEIFIRELLQRLTRSDLVKEIILATNPDMEGEATAMYLAKKLRELKTNPPAGGEKLKITRLAHGLPIGANIEYADERTLGEALMGRKEY